MDGRRYKKLIGKMVEMEWRDPAGFINEEMNVVKLADCTSWGILKKIDNDSIVLQTSVYKNSEYGDYTIVTLGCVTALRAYRKR